MNGKYAGIIGLTHRAGEGRRQMPNAERAAQFAAFAALTGYEEAVAETARLVSEGRKKASRTCRETACVSRRRI